MKITLLKTAKLEINKQVFEILKRDIQTLSIQNTFSVVMDVLYKAHRTGAKNARKPVRSY